jgi:prepilin-type N-terminal cleavage/methylation domain-containing protein
LVLALLPAAQPVVEALMRDRDNQQGTTRGFTLIEMTVVLAVVVTLALILTPSIANFINDARVARARNDCQTIASAIVQFYKDSGFFPQWSMAQAGGPGAPQNRVAVLASGGNGPQEIVPTLWTLGTGASLSGQLITNQPGYTLRTATSQFGWNGPYLSSDIGSDPWNNRYLVNVGQIDTAQGVQGPSGAPKSAVWVLSPGPNGIVDTPFTQSVLVAVIGGDDIGIRIQ